MADAPHPSTDDAHFPPVRRGGFLRLLVIFFAAGFSLSSWTSRLPAVQDTTDLTPQEIGFALLGMSATVVATMLLAGLALHSLGARVCLRAGAVLTVLGLLALACADTAGWAVAAILAVGVGTGFCDLAMNIVAAAQGKGGTNHIGMPFLHGTFSLGALVGALGGTVAAALDIPVSRHIPITAAVFGVAVIAASLGLGREAPVVLAPSAPQQPPPGLWDEWTRPRTLGIGLILLGLAFAEGTANEWLSLVFKNGYMVTQSQAAGGLAVFVGAMTVTRFAFGYVALRGFRRTLWRRYDLLLGWGVIGVTLGSGVVVLAGVVVKHWRIPGLVLAAVGVAIWGVSAALAFPLALAAAAEPGGPHTPRGRRARHREAELTSPGPARGEGRDTTSAAVSVVTTMGYTAALAGPPAIGWAATNWGYLSALSLVPLAVLGTCVLAAVVHPEEARHRLAGITRRMTRSRKGVPLTAPALIELPELSEDTGPVGPPSSMRRHVHVPPDPGVDLAQ